MGGSDSQIQFGELERYIKTTGCVNLSIDCDGDSMYAETMRAESREPRAESREPRVMASFVFPVAGAHRAQADAAMAGRAQAAA